MNERPLMQVVFDQNKGFGLQPTGPMRVISFVPECETWIRSTQRMVEAQRGFKIVRENTHAFSFGQRTGQQALSFMRTKIREVIALFGPVDLVMATDDWVDRRPAKWFKRFEGLAKEFGLYGVLVSDLPHLNN